MKTGPPRQGKEISKKGQDVSVAGTRLPKRCVVGMTVTTFQIERGRQLRPSLSFTKCELRGREIAPMASRAVNRFTPGTVNLMTCALREPYLVGIELG